MITKHGNTLHKIKGPELEDKQLKLAAMMGFKFRSGIG